MPERIRITREQLHRLLWSKTMRLLAKELATSYVELVKACTAMNVPRPAKGEWKLFMLGQSVEPIPLPEIQSGVATEFFLKPVESFNEEDLPALPEDPPADPGPVFDAQKVKVERVHGVEGPVEQRAPDRGPVTVTREKLYERVWQTPLKRLAIEWGTNYVQLVAACDAMNVPRPTHGHWTRLARGMPVEVFELPETGPDTRTEVTLDPQLLRAKRTRKAAWSAELLTSSEDAAGDQTEAAMTQKKLRMIERPLAPGHIALPVEGTGLHPIADRHIEALLKASPGELGFVSVKGPDLFACDVTSALVPRLGRGLCPLMWELERRGYSFQNGEAEGEGLGIIKGGDKVELRWSEEKIEFEREPTNVDKRKPSWTWNLTQTLPTGKLSVEVVASGLKGKRKWTEGDELCLEEVLGAVAQKVETTFCWFGQRREREEELARKKEEAEKRRLEEAAKEAERQAKLEEERKERARVQRHQAKLEQIAELRRQNLLVAAKLWIQARAVAAYIGYCETTWRVRNGGKLTQSQTEWLEWAKAEVVAIGPFGKGYPLPEKDGKLESSTVPIGGPYPEPTELEKFPENDTNQPQARPEVKYVEVPRQPEQYPFWLLHRRH